MSKSWTTVKEFTPQYTEQQKHQQQYVVEVKLPVAEFVEYSIKDWPKISTSLKPYWGYTRIKSI